MHDFLPVSITSCRTGATGSTPFVLGVNFAHLTMLLMTVCRWPLRVKLQAEERTAAPLVYMLALCTVPGARKQHDS